jgi:hypothetical protein
MQPPGGNRTQRPRIHDYLLNALIAYLLPWLAVLVEMVLTWGQQIQLATHGIGPFFSPYAYLWMMIPAVITFLILVPFIRRPTRRWAACGCIFLGWMLLMLLNQTGMK